MEGKSKIKKIMFPRLLLGIVIGSVLGFGYYYFIGCTSGNCAITSSPINSTAYGMLLGGILFFKEKDMSEEPNVKNPPLNDQ